MCDVLAAEVSSRIAAEDFEHLSVAEVNERLDNMSENLGEKFKACIGFNEQIGI